MPGADGAVRWVADPLEIAHEIGAEHRVGTLATASQESYEDAVRRLTDGDNRPEVLAAIDRGRERGRRMAQPLAERMRWDLAEVGAVPSVPHYLAGCERTMYRPAATVSETAPLRVWVSAMAHFSYTEAECIERGAVLAGIVDALAAVRPVRLTIFFESQGPYGVRIAWDVDPRDGSRLAAQLGQSLLRGVLIRWMHHARIADLRYHETADEIRAHFGIPDGDMVVRAFHRGGGGTAETDLHEFLDPPESTR